MDIRERIARLPRLSDDDLLAGLSGALGSSQRLMALVIAHLGEVEERRLHLIAGHESMFAYCTHRLGMSEDEACRRIEVARLARRFPVLFAELAGGRISLSVAALLKPHLSEDNHVALLAAVSGRTVTRAREVLAAWFPRPDVITSIRKLPERRGDARAESGARDASPLFESASDEVRDAPAPAPAASASPSTCVAQAPTEPIAVDRPPAASLPATKRPPPALEPLSPERFRVQFTADLELKRKLDLARDLLRHALPSGDLAAIVGRALDLLIEKTLQRRFGQAKRTKTAKPATARRREPPSEASSSSPASTGATSTATTSEAPTPTATTAAATTATPQHVRHLPNEIRRTVLDRDGLRCTWQGPDGTRCNSRAWLEHDHVVPRGLGGSDDPANIRPLCRPHNRLAAEQAYGKSMISRVIAGRRARGAAPGTPTSAIR